MPQQKLDLLEFLRPAREMARNSLTSFKSAAAAVVFARKHPENKWMPRKRTTEKTRAASHASILLVGSPSASLDRKHSLLRVSGFKITLAENICLAEVLSETCYFDAVVYDESLPPQEQASLAGLMRIRWPWMRLISCGLDSGGEIVDSRATSESQLAEILRQILTY
jgi:hypothetical protein